MPFHPSSGTAPPHTAAARRCEPGAGRREYLLRAAETATLAALGADAATVRAVAPLPRISPARRSTKRGPNGANTRYATQKRRPRSRARDADSRRAQAPLSHTAPARRSTKTQAGHANTCYDTQERRHLRQWARDSATVRARAHFGTSRQRGAACNRAGRREYRLHHAETATLAALGRRCRHPFERRHHSRTSHRRGAARNPGPNGANTCYATQKQRHPLPYARCRFPPSAGTAPAHRPGVAWHETRPGRREYLLRRAEMATVAALSADAATVRAEAPLPHTTPAPHSTKPS